MQALGLFDLINSGKNDMNSESFSSIAIQVGSVQCTISRLTESRNSTPKWEEENLQATRTDTSRIFRPPVVTSTVVAAGPLSFPRTL